MGEKKENTYKVEGMGRRNIGKLMDNRIEDIELARRILECSREALELGRLGKPKTVQELEDRFNTFLQKCVDYGMPPTVERLGIIYSL